MLFNSYAFIFAFLPLTLLGFHLIGSRGHVRIAICWLVGASLFFYGWWNPVYLGLILASILFNYSVGVSLSKRAQKSVLTIGISANLLLLGYFKYANFFVDNFIALTGNNIVLDQIILPLAISFFTFQQIVYLIDCYRGETTEYSFLHYCLFVTFFPQLIAGPIVHQKEMLPQFVKDTLYKLKAEHVAVGLTIFVIGLFKKAVIADGIAVHATPVFDAAELGMNVTFFEAWGGAFAYSFQLYFDFSGYSDMAIGLARMFGVKLPVNFYSPYKANNIIEFWRRWHITLSRFLRDYLYYPLGGNRKGPARRHINLLITMLLGGLWHGAGWTFVLWGGLHGLYLVVNHGWHALKRKAFGIDGSRPTFMGLVAGKILTAFAIVIGWVLFRAETLDGALRMFDGMRGVNGISFPNGWGNSAAKLQSIIPDIPVITEGFGSFGNTNGYLYLVLLFFVTWFGPNSMELLRGRNPALGLEPFETKSRQWHWLTWHPSVTSGLITGILAYSALVYIILGRESEFLYFNF